MSSDNHNDNVAITASGLGKKYNIYNKPVDRLKHLILSKAQSHFNLNINHSYCREFWALKEVGFEIKRGECFGILGRNGAGKSTLLQIIAGTLDPTEGEVHVNGRIAALLELGSGFDPEFSGRENVYMNATLLGLTKKEIDERFEEIISFSEIGDFLDQPVKTYSSGMLVRLAFSTAIHLNPDILIVDEALAVGDFAFQHKCMSRIKKIIDSGVTVLLVTHDVGAVMANCTRALMLKNGKIDTIGTASDVCDRYLETAAASFQDTETNSKENRPSVRTIASDNFSVEHPELEIIESKNRWGRGGIRSVSWSLSNTDGEQRNNFRFRERMVLSVLLQAEQHTDQCFPGFMIRDRNGYHLTGITNLTCGHLISNIKAGEFLLLRYEIELLYRPDNYSILLNIATDEIGTDFYDICENVGNFTIIDDQPTAPPWGYGRMYLPTTLTLSKQNGQEQR
ncbi:MAG: ABC transporter ATP-binding protein [Pusillimonas sp.]|nr:ABC transporter ATP-binding protein [Pusillimonas sp.]|tara:strand:+ start:33407 stop:34765 length:1359 start_codon:yes stop_codon:yes gene_type:complete